MATETVEYSMVSPSIVRSTRVSSMPVASSGRSDSAARAWRPFGDQLVPTAGRGDVIDQAPLDGGVAPDALGPGGERIGEVAADMALVDDPGESAGAGKHGQQGNLGQRDRR